MSDLLERLKNAGAGELTLAENPLRAIIREATAEIERLKAVPGVAANAEMAEQIVEQATEIERMHQTIAWWAGEGTTRHPEENEYLELCKIHESNRTPAESERLRKIAGKMNRAAQMSEYAMVEEIERLKGEIAAALEEGIRRYAWWKDGVQYVGTCGTTLEAALRDAELGDEDERDVGIPRGGWREPQP